jgi:hypothetical protein
MGFGTENVPERSVFARDVVKFDDTRSEVGMRIKSRIEKRDADTAGGVSIVDAELFRCRDHGETIL